MEKQVRKFEKFLGVTGIIIEKDDKVSYDYSGFDEDNVPTTLFMTSDLFWAITFSEVTLKNDKRLQNIKKIMQLLGIKEFNYNNVSCFIDLCEKTENFGNFYKSFMECYYNNDLDVIELLYNGIESISDLIVPYNNFVCFQHLRHWALEKYCEYIKSPIESYRVKEKQYQKYVIKDFKNIFPEYDFVSEYDKVDGIGNLDILAKDKVTNRPVIIELKVDTKNPNKQLIAYGSAFANPILVALTTIEVPEIRRLKNIIYRTLPFIK